MLSLILLFAQLFLFIQNTNRWKMNESWLQIASLFIANAGLILWFRSESRADWRHMDAKIDAQLSGIREEIRDFHGRLCAIEERRNSK